MTVSVALSVLALATHLSQSAPRARETGPGVITGVVVNERREPVADANVQAFPAPTVESPSGRDERAPFTTSAIGQATTDSLGRFRIAGLPLGDYLVGARARSAPPGDASKQTLMYMATFHPSVISSWLARSTA